MPVTPVLLLRSMFRRRLASGTSLRCESLPGAALCHIVRGEVLLSIDRTDYRASAHQWLLLRPGMRIEANALGSDAEYCLLFLGGTAVDSRTGAAASSAPAPWERLAPASSGRLRLRAETSLVRKLAELQEAYRSRREDPFLTNVRFQALLSSIAEQSLHGEPEAAEASGIGQSIAYINRNYTHKIRLDTLADIAGFTPTSYSREFKKVIGMSPIEYVNELRIAKAKRLLLDRRNTIKRVSDLSGFSSEFYFSRMFRRATGVSPTVFMKRGDMRIAVASSFRYDNVLRSLGVQPAVAINCRKHRMMNEQEHRLLMQAGLAELERAKPDLVLCDPWHLSMLEEADRAAPLLGIGYTMDWQLIHRDIAEAIGREAAASVNLAKLEKKLEQTRKAVARRFGGESFTFMRVLDRLIRIQGVSNHPLNSLLYEEVGLRPGYCVHSNLMHVEYPSDNYPDLGTDHLIVQTPASTEDAALYRSLRHTAFWQAMRPAAACRIYDAFDWVGLSWSPIGRMRILDELLQIAGAGSASGGGHGAQLAPARFVPTTGRGPM